MPTTSRPGEPRDAVAGVVPARVYEPISPDECAEVMAREGGRVAFVGGGTALELGRPPAQLDAVVRTGRMARIVEYAPADMVLIAEAGITLAQLQATARREGQMLALDPPQPERATLGGLVATAGFGPGRARHGAVRDLVLGAAMVRADGVLARSGGKVVKNVAGFDLAKLLCGSLGTLGLVAEVTVRLHPLPEASQTVVTGGLSAAQVVALLAGARRAQLEPTAAVALAGERGLDLGVRFDGFAAGVREQAARLAAVARAAELACEAPTDAAPFWRRHDEARLAGPLRVKVTALPSRLAEVVAAIAPLRVAVRGSFAWYATLGIGFAGGEVLEDGAAGAAIEAARDALVAAGGSLVIEAAPASLRAIDPWGPPPPSFAVMAALKRRFDPDQRLNPGRFVGGL
jgi:glycolate oxidase FAD binding subunit